MKESDIRPADIFEEYLRLSAEDARVFFHDCDRSNLNCPACDSDESAHEFVKHGFAYVSCTHCRTLYQSPRPPLENFEQFYSSSKSSRYWAEKFFPSVAEARRERIFKPRVDNLARICETNGLLPQTVMDVGAGYGIFLEEWQKRFTSTRVIAIEPSKPLAEVCRSKRIEVVEAIAERVSGFDGSADLVVCFEVLEHVYRPVDFLKTLAKFAKPGGYLLVSTLGVDGFDIQTLWQESNSISPPHHINFLSIEGFDRVFERAGLAEVEISTPGQLDVDIVRNAYQKNPAVVEGRRFVERILANDAVAANFQQFLIDSKLSSHTWVFAKKPD